MSGMYFEKQVAISGIGQSEISRGSSKSALELTVDASLEAIGNAGLTRRDIDGISTWPGSDRDTSGFSPVGVPDLQDALRLQVSWYGGGREAPGQYGAVFNAIGAIAAGVCRHVLVYRTVYEASARKMEFANSMLKPGQRVANYFRWFAPYYAYAAAVQQALYFQRYVHESGIKPEQIAQIAINGRRNAALNPKAIYRRPITVEDYLSSPIIATPLHLLDCDVPIDGSTAIILSHIDAARDLPNPVTRIEAIGSALHYRNSWTQIELLAEQCAPSPAAMMWSRTDLKPADVDVAELYDGFSFHTLAWIEAFGFCGRYEAGAFIEGGQRIALDGDLPINTNGGALSAGRMHAYGQVHEACIQLWGRGGQRQVQGEPKVAALCTAGGPLGGCMLLVRD
jgi:acetyl-CoA acetyltransferase